MKRPERPIHLAAALLVLSVLLLAGGPAHAAPAATGGTASRDGAAGTAATDDSPDEIRARLADVTNQYEKSQDRLGLLTRRTNKVGREITGTKKRLVRSRERVAQTAQVAYTSGGVDNSVLTLLGDEGPDKTIERMTTLSLLSSADDIALRDANRERRQYRRQLADLKQAKRKAAAERASLQKRRAELNETLREALEERRERASRGRTTGRWACPVGSPYNMMNTFGAARGGGRSHEGTDIASPKSNPIYAVEDGTIARAYYNGLGGIALILEGESGDSYYYAHQETNLVRTGQRVKAGQLIARVGMTGDAQGTIYHLHFERWPNGGSAVDPWPFLLPLCGENG